MMVVIDRLVDLKVAEELVEEFSRRRSFSSTSYAGFLEISIALFDRYF